MIVCGHHGCGGVRAALQCQPLGLIDNWLRHIREVHVVHRADLDAIGDEETRVNRLCELNIAAQVTNLCGTTVVQDAWRRGRPLSVHGWIYSLSDGLLRDLNISVDQADELSGVDRTQ